ncbi:MAG: carbon storage regulator, partial [Firmicutes bacterium]|nr:carbon storage regulator [Bacillota bacterium]
MLVLTRRSGESIVINDDIKVTVVSVSTRSGRPY